MNKKKVYLLIPLFFFFVLLINTNIASAIGPDKQINSEPTAQVSVRDRIKSIEKKTEKVETAKPIQKKQQTTVTKTKLVATESVEMPHRNIKTKEDSFVLFKEKFEKPKIPENVKGENPERLNPIVPQRPIVKKVAFNNETVSSMNKWGNNPSSDFRRGYPQDISSCERDKDANYSSGYYCQEETDSYGYVDKEEDSYSIPCDQESGTYYNPSDEEDTDDSYDSDEDYDGIYQLDMLTTAKVYDVYGNIIASSKAFSIAENLLTNSRFERSSANYTTFPQGWERYVEGDKGYIRLDSREKMSGTQSVQIVTNSTSTQLGCIALIQLVPVAPNETYTLSGSIRTTELTNAYALFNTHHLQITENNHLRPVQDTPWIFNEYSRLTGTHDWTKRQLTFTTGHSTSFVLVFLEVVHEQLDTRGSAWFDHIQIERGHVSTAYNLVENSSFEEGLDNWYRNPLCEHGILDQTESLDGGQSIKFFRTKTTDPLQQLSQKIILHQSKPEPITITGLSKALDVQNWVENYPNNFYGIAFDAMDYDGGYHNSGTVCFSLGTHDWERAAVTIIPTKPIKQLNLYVRIGGNNTGTVLFDHIRAQIGRAFTIYEYSSEGKITKITDIKGNSCQFTYDKGKVTCTDPKGNNQKFIYNNNQLQALESPTDAKAEYTRDRYGNLTKKRITSKDGLTTYNQTSHAYDQTTNQLVKITNPLNLSTSYAYDEDENGNTLVQVTDPDGTRVESIYDLTGRIIAKCYNGIPRYYYSYNDQTNEIQVEDVELNQIKVLSYDQLDRLTNIKTAAGNIERTFDGQDNITKQQIIQGFSFYTHYFKHNALGQNTLVINPLGNKYYFDFDENGNIITLVQGNGSSSTIVHDDNDRVIHIHIDKNDGSIVASNYTYDPNIIASYDYTYDPNNNITSIRDQFGRVTIYAFDSLEQLISETDPATGNTTSYTYSPVGNRTTKVVKNFNGDVLLLVNYKYNQANQLTEVTSKKYNYDNKGTLSHIDVNNQKCFYDQKGNLTYDGEREYIWDTGNRLIEVRIPGIVTTAKYAYDELSRRVRSTVNGQVTNFIYDGYSIRVLYETDAYNQLKRYYTYSTLGQLLSMTELGKGTYYYHTNAHGDVIAITDQFNQIVAIYTYDAWGDILYSSGYFADENPYRYAGYRYDKETRFYYLISRYYNPEHGNFLSLDPHPGDLEDLQSQNGYNYALNNPVMYIDPCGDSADAIRAVLGGLAALAPIPVIGEVAIVTAAAVATGAGIYYGGKYLYNKWQSTSSTSRTKVTTSTVKIKTSNQVHTKKQQVKNQVKKQQKQPKKPQKKIKPKKQVPRKVAPPKQAPKRQHPRKEAPNRSQNSKKEDINIPDDDDPNAYVFSSSAGKAKYVPKKSNMALSNNVTQKMGNITCKRNISGLVFKFVGRNLEPQRESIEHFLSRVQKSDGVREGKVVKSSKEYQVPKGGGGVTGELKIGNNTIFFGHGGRHLKDTGLDIGIVNNTVASNVIKQNLGKGRFYKGTVTVDGKTIEYTSYGLGDGKVNIGTYYPK